MTVELAMYLRCTPGEVVAMPDAELATVSAILTERARKK